jgi:hypothetical protein
MINVSADLNEELPRMLSLASNKLLLFTSVYAYETTFSILQTPQLLNAVCDMSAWLSETVGDYEHGHQVLWCLWRTNKVVLE